MNNNQQLLIIDTHVHIHDCFDLSTFFESAYDNCQDQATRQGSTHNFLGVLLLTESFSAHRFQDLQSLAKKDDAPSAHLNEDWTLHFTDEEGTLYAQTTSGARLLIAAGRQIITRENLEVLALLTGETFPDGESIEVTITQVQESGGITVLPWGFGKWWGSRGKIIVDLLSKSSTRQMFLGDNGGRPRVLPYPPQFTLAKHQGLHILPGSDPLPFPSEIRKPCSVGITIKGTVNPRTPGADLKLLFQASHSHISPYFQHETLYRFLKNQFALRLTNNGVG